MADLPSQALIPCIWARWRQSFLLFTAVTASWTVSQLGYYAQQQMLSPIMSQFGRGEEDVGWMYGAETATYAITILVAAVPLARYSRAGLALFGGAVLVAANLASGLIASGIDNDFELLQLSRVIAGAAAGLLGAAGTAAAASSLDPRRVYAIVMFTSGLGLAAEPSLIPPAISQYGAAGGFFALAGATAVMMPLLVWLLPPRLKEKEKKSTLWADLVSAPNRAFALFAMVALFIYEAGQSAVFMFIAEIGDRSGLNEQAVGAALTGTALAGLVGALFAAWLGGRFGVRWPIVIGIGGNVLAAVGLALVASAIPFFFLNVTWNLAYYFVVPYLMGVMAELDDRGRWVVAVDAIWWLGTAAAAPVGGMIIERSGYELLAAFPVITGVVCIAVFMKLLVRFNAQNVRPSVDGAVG
jgi:predicted MFS family arabinose efflux permease